MPTRRATTKKVNSKQKVSTPKPNEDQLVADLVDKYLAQGAAEQKDLLVRLSDTNQRKKVLTMWTMVVTIMVVLAVLWVLNLKNELKLPTTTNAPTVDLSNMGDSLTQAMDKVKASLNNLQIASTSVTSTLATSTIDNLPPGARIIEHAATTANELIR